jgi:hypothetical protein
VRGHWLYPVGWLLTGTARQLLHARTEPEGFSQVRPSPPDPAPWKLVGNTRLRPSLAYFTRKGVANFTHETPKVKSLIKQVLQTCTGNGRRKILPTAGNFFILRPGCPTCGQQGGPVIFLVLPAL